MTEQQTPVDEPDPTDPSPSVRPLPPSSHPRQSEARDEDGAADERTSPSPYAESFAEWVADETAPDGQKGHREAGDAT